MYPHRVIVRLTTTQMNKLKELAGKKSLSTILRRLIDENTKVSPSREQDPTYISETR